VEPHAAVGGRSQATPWELKVTLEVKQIPGRRVMQTGQSLKPFSATADYVNIVEHIATSILQFRNFQEYHMGDSYQAYQIR
jgi:hypothetical protein